MNNFRKIIACMLSVLLAVAPCMVFATEEAVATENFAVSEDIAAYGSVPTLTDGQVVGEDFAGATDGIDYWDVSEFIDGNSDLFASYRAHCTAALWYTAPGDTGAKGHCGIISAATEAKFRTTKMSSSDTHYAIHDYATSSVTDEIFRVTKVQKSAFGYNHFFELKYPIVSGVQRFSFDVKFSHAPDSFAQTMIMFYDSMPEETRVTPSTSSAIRFGFNGNNLYCYTNTDGTWNSSTTRGGTIVPGQTMPIDIVIDADNNKATFFVNDKFVRTTTYTANDPKVLCIADGATGAWLNSAKEPFVIEYDNFEQEKVIETSYDFSIADGSEDVTVDTVPLFTFNTPIEQTTADKIVVYKNGTVIDIKKNLSADGLELGFDLDLDYGSEYKFSLPANLYAKNKMPLDAADFTFDTEKFIINVGDKFTEDFSTIENGLGYAGLHEAMAKRAKDDDAIFSRYAAHINMAAYKPGSPTPIPAAITTQEYEDYLKTYVYTDQGNVLGIIDEVSGKVNDGRLTLSKNLPASQKLTIYHGFNLKHPITEGVYRFAFELESESAISSWANRFIDFLGEEITDSWHGAITYKPDTNASTLVMATMLGFNGSNLFFSSNYGSDGKAEDWQITPAEKLAKNVYQIEVIIDADNKRVSFFSNGAHIRSTSYSADAIRAIVINEGRNLPYTGAGGGEAVFHFDNFVQERLASPKYDFSVSDGSYGVAVGEKPTVAFGTPIDEAVALRIEAYEDGKLLEDAEKTFSEDGTTVTLNINMKNSAEYKLVVPGGLFAKNKAPIADGECIFRTEHKSLGIRQVAEYKPAYVANSAYTARATLTNNSGSEAPVIYIVALYDAKGKMIDVGYTAVTLGKTAENVPVTVTLPASEVASATVKTYLIDSFKTMYPVITDK